MYIMLLSDNYEYVSLCTYWFEKVDGQVHVVVKFSHMLVFVTFMQKDRKKALNIWLLSSSNLEL